MDYIQCAKKFVLSVLSYYKIKPLFLAPIWLSCGIAMEKVIMLSAH